MMEEATDVIELVSPADIEDLQNFWRSIPGLGVGQGDDRDSLALFINRNPSTSLLIRQEGAIAGTVLGGFDGRRGYIYHLAVHPDCQGRGYGQALLKRVCHELKELGALRIHLFVYGDNQAGISFYEHQGWIRRQDIQVMTWDNTKEFQG